MKQIRALLLSLVVLMGGVATSEALFGTPTVDLITTRIVTASVREEIMAREPDLEWMPAGTVPGRDTGVWRFSSGVPFDPVLEETGRGICDMDFYPDGFLMRNDFILWGRLGCPLLIQRQRLIEAFGEDEGDALFNALLSDMES